MSISRRTFIKGTIATSAVAAGTTGCGNDVNAAPIVDATVDDDPTSDHYGQIAIPVPKYPDLSAAGGAVTLRLAALPAGDRPFTVPPAGVLLVHSGSPTAPPEFIATRSDCPHQGCPLGYSAKDMMIECPCHASRFLAIADVSNPASCVGLVTHLPAQSNLTVYGTTVIGDYVYVDLRTNQSCGVSGTFPPVIGNTVTVPIAQFPALGTVGGSVIGQPGGLADTIIIARAATNEMVVLSSICTHRQCTVAFDLANMSMDCPCHGSVFGLDGQVLVSPATLPLKKYASTFDGTTVVITVS